MKKIKIQSMLMISDYNYKPHYIKNYKIGIVVEIFSEKRK